MLEGSVRKAGNRIRLTSQLVDTQTDAHIWAERYDRQLDDVFLVQEELTRSIVRAIAPQISETELARVRRRNPASLSAYELAVRANATASDAWTRSERARRLCASPRPLWRSIPTAPSLWERALSPSTNMPYLEQPSIAKRHGRMAWRRRSRC